MNNTLSTQELIENVRFTAVYNSETGETSLTTTHMLPQVQVEKIWDRKELFVFLAFADGVRVAVQKDGSLKRADQEAGRAVLVNGRVPDHVRPALS